MVWLTADQHYLIRDRLEPILALYGPTPHDHGVPLKAATFVLMTPTGKVVQRFSAPQDYSLEDDYGICNIYWVERDTLYDYHWVYGWGNEARLIKRVVLTELQHCTPPTITGLRDRLVALGVWLAQEP